MPRRESRKSIAIDRLRAYAGSEPSGPAVAIGERTAIATRNLTTSPRERPLTRAGEKEGRE